jgi:hypothetical protein
MPRAPHAVRPFLAPAVLGLLAFAGVVAAARLAPASVPDPVAAFTSVTVDLDHSGALLVVTRNAAPAIATLTPGLGPIPGHGTPLANGTLAPPGPRFGRDGAGTARLDLLVFAADGRLLAATAPPQDLGRFTLHREFRALPGGTWWLGQGPAPNGTTGVPRPFAGLLPEARAALDGLPVGGVAALRVDHGLLFEAYGVCYLAAQVSALPSPA